MSLDTQVSAYALAGSRSFLSAASLAACGRPQEEHDAERTRRQMEWLRTITADPASPHSAVRLAVVLLDYFNRESGEAWPSQRTLADKLGLKSTNALVTIVRAMVACGHLGCQPGRGVGEANSSRYWPTMLEGAQAKPSENFGFSDGSNPQLSDVKSPRKLRKSPSEGLRLKDDDIAPPSAVATVSGMEVYPDDAVALLRRAEFAQHLEHLSDGHLASALRAWAKQGLPWASLTRILANDLPHATQRAMSLAALLRTNVADELERLRNPPATEGISEAPSRSARRASAYSRRARSDADVRARILSDLAKQPMPDDDEARQESPSDEPQQLAGAA